MPWRGHVDSLIQKLSRRDLVSAEEQDILRGLATEPIVVERHQDLVSEGDRPDFSVLLSSGFAARYKMLEDGGRQITALHVMGDFVDLHSLLLKPMDHGVVTLAPSQIVRVPHERLREVASSQPHLGRLLWLSTLIDAAIHREWLVAMGRRTALGHTAHLICEVYSLLEVVRQTHNKAFELPLTQADLADVLGLSSVHVNRTIQELRASQTITWKGTHIEILNWNELVEIGEFDPTYLQLQTEPR